MHEKIRPHHLERKAILYVRQSSAHQVLHNRESRALQYAMRDRLVALGWSCIETVDDDLGRSAAGGVTRAGFDRMVAEVCLGKVGAVAAQDAGHRRGRGRADAVAGDDARDLASTPSRMRCTHRKRSRFHLRRALGRARSRPPRLLGQSCLASLR